MRGIRDDRDRVAWTNHRRKPQTSQVQLITQRANVSIQRHLVVIAGSVEINLGLALYPGVIDDTQTRSPVVSEGVVLRRSPHLVLFPAYAKPQAQVFVHG